MDFNNLMDKVTDGVKDKIEDVAKSQLANKVGDFSDTAKDAIADKVQDFVDPLKAKLAPVVGEEMIEKVEDAVEPFINQVTDKIEDAVNDITNKFDKDEKSAETEQPTEQ